MITIFGSGIPNQNANAGCEYVDTYTGKRYNQTTFPNGNTWIEYGNSANSELTINPSISEATLFTETVFLKQESLEIESFVNATPLIYEFPATDFGYYILESIYAYYTGTTIYAQFSSTVTVHCCSQDLNVDSFINLAEHSVSAQPSTAFEEDGSMIEFSNNSNYFSYNIGELLSISGAKLFFSLSSLGPNILPLDNSACFVFKISYYLIKK